MITVDLIGAMNLFAVELNSVTVVNLVMCIGIGVQFCVHTGYHFSINPIGSKTERAQKALIEVGSSLVCGMTISKIVGIVAFAFGSAAMFEDYFFKVYLCFLVLAALHGFVFFPVLLSFLGKQICWSPNNWQGQKPGLLYPSAATRRQLPDTNVHWIQEYTTINSSCVIYENGLGIFGSHSLGLMETLSRAANLCFLSSSIF